MHSSPVYLAVDIGGSKTLAAVFSEDGKILHSSKIPTDKNYSKFLVSLEKLIPTLNPGYKLRAACCAVPGLLDRAAGVALNEGNLPWHNVPIREDVSKMLGDIPVLIENDAKLAGLSEALLHKEYRKVLYLTISTGIGDGIIIDGIIDADFLDSEAGQMVLEHEGKLQKWEDFASGRALHSRYGKKASEIDDPSIWQQYVKGLSQGIDTLVATLVPDVIIIGGGVGAHFDKFGSFLDQELRKYENHMVKMPPVIAAKRPEEAVIYGCYEYIRQNL